MSSSVRAFDGLGNWRGLAIRYGEHAIVCRGGLVLAAALPWLMGPADGSGPALAGRLCGSRPAAGGLAPWIGGMTVIGSAWTR